MPDLSPTPSSRPDTTAREHAETTFPVDACERLQRSEYDYYSTHGEYIRPLAFLLNETRKERDALLADVESGPPHLVARLMPDPQPPAPACDGTAYCNAETHVHGCYSDSGDCDSPGEHKPVHEWTAMQTKCEPLPPPAPEASEALVETVRVVLSGYSGPVPKWPERGEALDALDALAARLREAERKAEYAWRFVGRCEVAEGRLREAERERDDAQDAWQRAEHPFDKSEYDAMFARAEAAEARARELEEESEHLADQAAGAINANLWDDYTAAVKALRYARDAISSPLHPFTTAQGHGTALDVYETSMMMKALREIDRALLGSGEEQEPGAADDKEKP